MRLILTYRVISGRFATAKTSINSADVLTTMAEPFCMMCSGCCERRGSHSSLLLKRPPLHPKSLANPGQSLFHCIRPPECLYPCGSVGQCSLVSQWPAVRFTLATIVISHHTGQLRLMIKTVLSSIRSSSPAWRSRSSRLTAYSSSALHMSLGDCRLCSRMTFSSCRRSSLSLPS